MKDPYVPMRKILNWGVYNQTKRTWFKLNMTEKEARKLSGQLNSLVRKGRLDPN